MSTKDSGNLLDTVQAKIAELLDEFRAGEISREQFNTTYGRYKPQRDLALRVAASDVDEHAKDASTFDIKNNKIQKAIGVGIYHHQSQSVIETLGDFSISLGRIMPVLAVFAEKIKSDTFVEPTISQLPDGQCLLYLTEDYTTAILVFNNEPSSRQIKNLQLVMQDFEQANRSFLQKGSIESAKLAQPFVCVVKSQK